MNNDNISLFVGVYFCRLCVILFTTKGKNEEEKAKLRAVAKDAPFPDERVHFVYLYEDIQTRVVKAMEHGAASVNSNNGTVLKVRLVILKLMNI